MNKPEEVKIIMRGVFNTLIMKKMMDYCEELGEHDTPLCTCRDGNLHDLEERVKARRIRNAKRDSKL